MNAQAPRQRLAMMGALACVGAGMIWMSSDPLSPSKVDSAGGKASAPISSLVSPASSSVAVAASGVSPAASSTGHSITKLPAACPPGQTWFDEPVGLAQASGCRLPGDSADGGSSLQEGVWTLSFGNGRVARGAFAKGRREGLWTTYYADGSKAVEEPYRNGLLEGVQVEYTPEGQKFAERPFVGGMVEGVAITYLPDGTQRRELWRKGKPLFIPPIDSASPSQPAP